MVLAGMLGRRGPCPPALSGLAHDEPLEMTLTAVVLVVPAGRAGARWGARHRADVGVPALVQGPQAGHLDRLAPAAVPLDGHEPLQVLTSVGVIPGGRAVAPRAARHRPNRGAAPALVQGPEAGHIDRLAPDAVLLVDHEPLTVRVVVPAGRAVARGSARHRVDRGVLVAQGRQAGHLDRLAPDAVTLVGHEPLPVAAAVRVVPAGR